MLHDVHAEFMRYLGQMEHVFQWRISCCPAKWYRDDFLQDMRLLAWARWKRLEAQGKDPAKFAGLLAHRVASRVLFGRGSIGGAEKRRSDTERKAAVEGHRRTPHRFPNPARQAILDLDVKVWKEGLGRMRRRVLTLILAGYRTGEIAGIMHVSPARISGLRFELSRSWFAFQDCCRADWTN